MKYIPIVLIVIAVVAAAPVDDNDSKHELSENVDTLFNKKNVETVKENNEKTSSSEGDDEDVLDVLPSETDNEKNASSSEEDIVPDVLPSETDDEEVKKVNKRESTDTTEEIEDEIDSIDVRLKKEHDEPSATNKDEAHSKEDVASFAENIQPQFEKIDKPEESATHTTKSNVMLDRDEVSLITKTVQDHLLDVIGETRNKRNENTDNENSEFQDDFFQSLPGHYVESFNLPKDESNEDYPKTDSTEGEFNDNTEKDATPTREDQSREDAHSDAERNIYNVKQVMPPIDDGYFQNDEKIQGPDDETQNNANHQINDYVSEDNDSLNDDFEELEEEEQHGFLNILHDKLLQDIDNMIDQTDNSFRIYSNPPIIDRKLSPNETNAIQTHRAYRLTRSVLKIGQSVAYYLKKINALHSLSKYFPNTELTDEIFETIDKVNALISLYMFNMSYDSMEISFPARDVYELMNNNEICMRIADRMEVSIGLYKTVKVLAQRIPTVDDTEQFTRDTMEIVEKINNILSKDVVNKH